jgi:hypothetical protein
MPRRIRHPGSGKPPHNRLRAALPLWALAGVARQKARAVVGRRASNHLRDGARDGSEADTAETKERRRGTIASREEALVELSAAFLVAGW